MKTSPVLLTKVRRSGLFVLLVLIAPLLIGCEIPQAPEDTAEGAPPEPVYGETAVADGPAAVPADAPPAPGDTQSAAGVAPPAASDDADVDDAGAPDASGAGELIEAKAGVSGKGNYGPGFITTPISTYFTLRERVAFRHLESELKTYVAARGKLKDFKDVEEKVIKPAAINLPELPPGARYVYLPDQGPWGEIMVLKKDADKK